MQRGGPAAARNTWREREQENFSIIMLTQHLTFSREFGKLCKVLLENIFVTHNCFITPSHYVCSYRAVGWTATGTGSTPPSPPAPAPCRTPAAWPTWWAAAGASSTFHHTRRKLFTKYHTDRITIQDNSCSV